jgi:hypothetical protein
MTEHISGRDAEERRGLLGDARPDRRPNDPQTGGSRPQEEVEDRENVSTVTPESYPAADRAISQPR